LSTTATAAGRPLRVGIQGVRASFHDVAARRHFVGQALEPVECPSFSGLCASLRDGQADRCLMAIENSIAGSILTNYGLLETHGFKIAGEVYLRIELHLMALPGQQLADIRQVQSHPMALLQCDDFLSAHPHIRAVEGNDTAEVARDIAAQKTPGVAAIASRLAADTYGLAILAEGIETNRQNYTRFLVICRPGDHVSAAAANKASLRFEVAHRPGSLARVLDVFAARGLNLTKIQSVPLLGRPYEYSFHVDLEWDDRQAYLAALQDLAPWVQNLTNFGEYLRGDRPVV
jgi:prephenate dehydratase